MKYIFITGGVVSGLGKGITAASLGRLLKNRGYKVVTQKFDPYINANPGAMSPLEHGEVFLTEDGAQTDLDLGHYERFTDENLNKYCSVTTGKIYAEVLEKEKQGEYAGKTIQVIPHITNAIKERVYKFDKSDVDVVITEIGGTVGDIEGLPFLEAIRQVGIEKEANEVVYIHVTLLPYIYGSNELKSKPTQHSVKELQSLGIKPDILVCRAEQEIEENMKSKIALFCNVRKEDVIQNKTVDVLYEVPMALEKEGLAIRVCQKLGLTGAPNNSKWETMIAEIKKPKEKTVSVAIVGEYVKLEDCYLSIIESIKHGSFANYCNVEINLIDSAKINGENVNEKLKKYQGILIADGLNPEKIQGGLVAVQYARENKIPFLGIEMGMQMAMIEFVKNVVKNEEMPSIFVQKEKVQLGACVCNLKEGSLANKIYGQNQIEERRANCCQYLDENQIEIENAGLICSGKIADENETMLIELKDHPFFIGCQFHPEFKSRPDKPHPIVIAFVKACLTKECDK